MTIVYQNGVPGKICANPECGWKPLSQFHSQRSHRLSVGDGYKSRCKQCFNAQARAERLLSLNIIKLEHTHILKPTKNITVISSVLTKRQILKSTKKHSLNIVKCIVKKSMPKLENADCKNWNIIAKSDEDPEKSMRKSEMPISGSIVEKNMTN